MACYSQLCKRTRMGCRRIHRLRIRMEYLGILLPTLQLGMERYVQWILPRQCI